MAEVEEQRILWDRAARNVILQVTDRTGCGSGWYGQALPPSAHLVPRPRGCLPGRRARSGRRRDRRAVPELDRSRPGAGRRCRGAARAVAAAGRRPRTVRRARPGPLGALAGGAGGRTVAGRPGRWGAGTGDPVVRRCGAGHPVLRRRRGPRPRPGPARRPGAGAGRCGAGRRARLRPARRLAAARPRRAAAAGFPDPAGLRQGRQGALRHQPAHPCRLDACLAGSAKTGTRRGRPLPLTARAARAYLDVRFFHPFDDGNARSAFLALVFVLAREGVALDGVGLIRRITCRADDPQDAVSLARSIGFHTEDTRRTAASRAS
ncbi:Fic family protein [Streptomyces sp. NPDC020817]|uniref:Fic family protein n=1 Tax=Streptomyces sp. NPDC020817 TaxID=3365095 RepID=UPI0037872AA2